ncbi:MAG TPA: S1 family peptidase [Allosphingosinicella sp.]|jgi:hypothetical protein|nr:S1 family peptidase [Allosphingosinicella sp.]
MNVFLIGIAATVLAVPASAEPSGEGGQAILSEAEALAIDAQYYASRYNVPLAEATRRVRIMAEQDDLVAELGLDPEDVSGIWFDHGAQFAVQVRTVQPYKGGRKIVRPPRSRSAPAAGRSAARSPASEAAVAAAGSAIDSQVEVPVAGSQRGGPSRRAVAQFIARTGDALKSEIPTLDSVSYDEREQVIVLQIVDKSVTAASVSVKGPVPYKVVHVAQPMVRTSVVGGSKLYYADAARTFACTAAFLAKDPAGNPGILTAGHCNWAGGYIYKDGTREYALTGDTRLNRNDGYADMRFFKIPTTDWLPQFYGNKGEAARALTGRRTISSTSAKYTDGVAQGTVICFYGQTTGPVSGQGCGEVTFKQVYFPAGGGTPTAGVAGSYYLQFLGSFACAPGDSGAPVFAYNTAFGVLSGCDTVGTDIRQRTAAYTSTDLAYANSFTLAY